MRDIDPCYESTHSLGHIMYADPRARRCIMRYLSMKFDDVTFDLVA